MSSQAVAWAIVHNAGSMGGKAVLLSIANYANEYGECWASQSTLAEGACCCVRQLRRILIQLEELGLLERERRGGAGKGRDTDMIRLRMREMPVIISAKRRETQPDNMSASQSKGTISPVARGQDVRGATGHLRGGNRTMMSDNPKNPSFSNEKETPARQLLSQMRKVMSATGNQRSKPIPCEKALTPIIKRYGFEAVLAAAVAFYSTPQARKDGGEFQPGLQVIANDGRLEALITTTPPAQSLQAEREAAYRDHGVWNDAWGPIPSQANGGKP